MLPKLVSRVAITLLLCAFCTLANAEEAAPPAESTPMELPPWMTADVIKATIALNMTAEQKPEFNKAVGQYITDHFAMIQKEVKRNAPDLDMRIRSRDKALVHTMDEEVHKILTSEQWPAYKNYKKALGTALSSNVAVPVPSEPRSGPATR